MNPKSEVFDGCHTMSRHTKVEDLKG